MRRGWITLDIGERLADIGSGRLRELVPTVLVEPGAVLGVWDAVPLKGGFAAFDVARSLFKIRGTARVGTAERP